jgi:hypothetical protein
MMCGTYKLPLDPYFSAKGIKIIGDIHPPIVGFSIRALNSQNLLKTSSLVFIKYTQVFLEKSSMKVT